MDAEEASAAFWRAARSRRPVTVPDVGREHGRADARQVGLAGGGGLDAALGRCGIRRFLRGRCGGRGSWAGRVRGEDADAGREGCG